jgi:hypothetical protein
VRAGEAVIDAPEWTPRRPARHFVPSFSVLSPLPVSLRFELSVRARTSWSPWIATAILGDADGFEPLGTVTGGVASEIDLFVAAEPVESARLRLRVRSPDLDRVLAASWLLTLSASGPGAVERRPAARGPVRLTVPPLSQLEEPTDDRMRICSPTSVAMVLGRWDRQVPLATVAREVFHPATDRYGVWPANVLAAGRHGVAGYLLRFPDWTTAVWCLDAGLPIVASVRYARGELAGAALEETDGHLIVLTGYDGDDALVNDPVASDRTTVARKYRVADLERVWLDRSGVGYVFFDPAHVR